MSRQIRTLPSQYILKSWTEDAKCGGVKLINEVRNTKGKGLQYSDMCHNSIKKAVKALDSMTAVEKILIGEVENTTAPSCFNDNFASQRIKGIQENRKSGLEEFLAFFKNKGKIKESHRYLK